jgi:hypothetical protein
LVFTRTRADLRLRERVDAGQPRDNSGARRGLVEVERVVAMDAHEALIAIQRLARIALASEEGQSVEVLADIQRRALNGIVLVTERALRARGQSL